MAKDPAFLFYYQDFLVGTALMTAEEVGNYTRLLCHQADKRDLSIEDMQSICKGYALSKRIMEKFFKDENGRYYNVRLRQEVEKRRIYAESRRENAKAYAKHMEDENENIVSKKDRVVGKGKKKFGDFVLMTEVQHARLAEQIGPDLTDRYIDRLNNYIGSKGKKYKSHYHTILNWHGKDADNATGSGKDTRRAPGGDNRKAQLDSIGTTI